MKCSIEYLRDKLIEAGLHSFVQVKNDGSIRPTESHPKSVEVVVLATEAKINEVIKKLCDVLASRRVEAVANESCGMHVHLDMRNRDVKECYKNLYYSQGILVSMVPSARRSEDSAHAQRYCKKNTTPDIDKYPRGDRYHVINVDAYEKYKTLEIRVHSGTTNALKINNWITILNNIVNAGATDLAYPVKKFSRWAELFNINEELQTYIIKRAEKFEKKENKEEDFAA